MSDWKRLGAYVVRRRNELGYSSQAALEEASGVSYRTISRLENGGSVGKNSLGKLERALHWKLGSMEVILSGGEPTFPEPDARRAGRAGPAPWETYRVTAEESLNLLQIAFEDYGPGGFWKAFDEIYFGREDTQRTSHESPSDQQGQPA